ncbi:MAG: MarR family winged helix-turn-helix transcriptional regulator [Cryomorphaceae bacterium]|nr:MarR family transcriptional regulator [Flavobacteriales bacterium]
MISKAQPPFVRSLHLITKDYFGVLAEKLNHLDLERYFYPLIVIAKEGEGITQKKLSDLLELDKVTTSRIVDYLACKGYLGREQNPDDRRIIRLKPTDKAISDASEIEAAMRKIESELFATVSDKERKCFEKVVRTLGCAISEMPKESVKFDYKKLSNK